MHMPEEARGQATAAAAGHSRSHSHSHTWHLVSGFWFVMGLPLFALFFYTLHVTPAAAAASEPRRGGAGGAGGLEHRPRLKQRTG
jgi:hypothetical protein